MSRERLRILCAGALVSLSAAIATTMVAMALWLHLSPKLTLGGMADAARRGDATALASYMDMPTMRRNALARIAHDMARQSEGTMIRMRGDLAARILAGPAVDARISMRHLQEALKSAPDKGDTVVYRVSRSGMGRFYVSILIPHKLNLEFTRHGAGWMMTDMWNDGPERTISI